MLALKATRPRLAQLTPTSQLPWIFLWTEPSHCIIPFNPGRWRELPPHWSPTLWILHGQGWRLATPENLADGEEGTLRP